MASMKEGGPKRRSDEVNQDVLTDAEPFPMDQEYWAFISYRHSDNEESGREWARWLQQKLERYEIPQDLVGEKNKWGDKIPKSLSPIFRDEDDLPAASDFFSTICQKLKNSKSLIVICSPRTAASNYVAEEIKYFKKHDRADRILALMIEGEPHCSSDTGKQDGCFPPILIYHLNADDSLDTKSRSEPIAADVRLNPGGRQGWTDLKKYRNKLLEGNKTKKEVSKTVTDYEAQQGNAVLKIVAGTIGVDLSILKDRHNAHQLALEKKRNRTRRMVIIALSAITMIALVGLVASIIFFHRAKEQARNAEAAQARAEVGEAAAKKAHATAVNERVEAEAILTVITYDLNEKLKHFSPARVRDEILQKVTNYYGKTGFERHGSSKNDLATHYMQIGNLELDAGSLTNALEFHQMARDLRVELVAEEPDAPGWIRNLAADHINLGKVTLLMGNLGEALKLFEKAGKLAEESIAIDPTNLKSQTRYLNSSYWMAEVYQKQGNLPSSLEVLTNYVDRLVELVRSNPSEPQLKQMLSSGHTAVGDLHLKAGQSETAIEHYEEALILSEELVELAPGNALYKSNLAVSYERMGVAYEDFGETERALTQSERKLQIDLELVKGDRHNVNHLRNLSITYRNLGDRKLLLGHVEDALEHYQKSLAESEYLTKRDPSNAEFRFDLSVTCSRLGNTNLELGDPNQALVFYATSLKLVSELVELAPDNVQYAIDQAISHSQIAKTHRYLLELPQNTGRHPQEAIEHFRKAIFILKRLKNDGRLNDDGENRLTFYEEELAELLGEPN